MKKWILVIFGIILCQSLYSQDWQWKTFTSMKEIRAITSTDSVLWAATGGGMLAYWVEEKTVTNWTNTEGLADNNALSIINENNDAVWIGFYNGYIQRYDIQKESFYTISEYEGQQITCLKIQGDSLLVGLDIGLSVYNISKKEVKETYKRLGTEFQVELPVNDILVVDDEVWLATDEGIAIGKLGTVNLLDPANWNNITTDDGLPDNQVNVLSLYNQTVFAGTPSNMLQYTDGNWISHLSQNILDINQDANYLYALTTSKVMQYKNESWIDFANSNNATNFCFSSDYKAMGSDNNFYILNKQNNWETVNINTMPSNRSTTMTVDHMGLLYLGDGSSKSGGTGFSTYKDGIWTIYNRDNISLIENNDFVVSTVDQYNNVWLGTWGDGILVIKNDSTMVHYDETDGVLSSSSASNPNYPAITSLIEDNNGVIWTTIHDSQTNQPLVAITDSIVTHYGSSFSNDLISITVDSWNYKWIGSESNGVYVLDDAYTPHDRSDDTIYRVTSSDGLESENIVALAADIDGGVHIGTPLGLHYYLSDLSDIQYGLFSNNIKALAIDGVGNVWAGTQGGVSYYYDGSWHNFSVDNSPLVDNDVISLAVDKENGYVYVGTTKGISRITTHFIEPESEIKKLTIFPNPFIPAQHELVQIDGLIADVCVTIFTPSGHLIKKITTIDNINGRRVSWDGTDSIGQPVPGGIYLAVMSNVDGEKQIGKIALIR